MCSLPPSPPLREINGTVGAVVDVLPLLIRQRSALGQRTSRFLCEPKRLLAHLARFGS
jgi:hypothetical protein